MAVNLPARFQGEKLDEYVDRVVTDLARILGQMQQPGGLQSTIFDQQGRPMVSPFGVYGYNASGGAPVSPDIVQIDTQDIVDAAIETAKLGDDAVTSAKIVDLAVTTAKVHDAAIVTAKIGDLAVTTAKIDDLAVNGAKIANATIGTAKIVNAAITNALIDNLAVGTAQIQLAAITSALIGNLAVQNAHIANLSVDTIKIANQAVTNLAENFDGRFSVATAAAETVIQSVTITSTGASILIQASGSVETFSTPTVGLYTAALVRFKRNGSTLTSQMPICVSNQGAYAAGCISLAYVDTPAAGTYTYDITLENISSFDHGFRSLIFLGALELKK